MKSFNPIFLCLLFLTCSHEYSIVPPEDKSGSAEITVKLGAVGSLAKRTAIVLDTLTITLTCQGENSIIDNIPLSGQGGQTITKTFYSLASLKPWTATAVTKDTEGKMIHCQQATFTVDPHGEREVLLDCAALYSMLTVKFFPRRDSVDAYELRVDNGYAAGAYYSETSPPGDTVTLSYDYLTASPMGIRHNIQMAVTGIFWGDNRLLYGGDTVISVVSGENAFYAVDLKCFTPTPAPGRATMTVMLGTVGNIAITGELENGTHSETRQLFVDSVVQPGNNGLSWGTAFNDLQKALEKADNFLNANSETVVNVLIAQGTYFPGEAGDSSASFYLRKNIRLIGGYPRGGGTRNLLLNTTILCGTSSTKHVIRAVDVDSSAVLDGVTISGGGGGHGAGMWCVNASPKISDCTLVRHGNSVCLRCDIVKEGGAVFDSLSSPIFNGCTFSNNWADVGCGMFNTYSSPAIVNCTFDNNRSSRDNQSNNTGGGGICNFFSSPKIVGSVFLNNRANSGGAISNHSLSSPVIIGCTFRDNIANEFQGGAIANYNSHPTITNCMFINNNAWAGGGGAIYNDYASPKIVNCVFFRNRIYGHFTGSVGGAVVNWNSSFPIITNCTFDSNMTNWGDGFPGGALYDDSSSSATVTNCTFANNSATYDAAYHGSFGIFTNCTFWGDTARNPMKLRPEPSELTAGILAIKNCIVFGGYPGGTSIIDQDPNLGELHDNGGPVPTCAISPDSPAKDAGTIVVPSGVDISTDARGMPRSDGKPDMGAYEIQ